MQIAGAHACCSIHSDGHNTAEQSFLTISKCPALEGSRTLVVSPNLHDAHHECHTKHLDSLSLAYLHPTAGSYLYYACIAVLEHPRCNTHATHRSKSRQLRARRMRMTSLQPSLMATAQPVGRRVWCSVAARSSALRLRGRWLGSRRCCCWMRPRLHWTQSQRWAAECAGGTGF